MTTVVNVRNVNPWDPDVVYVGRANPRIGLKGSKWANPFKIGPFTREESIDAYRTFIQTEIREKPLLYRLDDLRGKKLACWCAPKACHGDVLAELCNAQVPA